ncbi:MAG: hypothetical protein U0574_07440 [Phycisphaerales bacterium]
MTLLAESSLVPTLLLLASMAAFLGLVAWLWLTPRGRWQQDAQIPLDPSSPPSTRSKDSSRGQH